jgi:hypothetical protein
MVCMSGQRLESRQVFDVGESHDVYLLADNKLLFFNDHADKFAKFDLNAPK